MSTATQIKLTPEQEWLSALVGAKLSPKPEDPLKDLDVEEIRGAMTFSVEKVPQGAIEHLKALVGKNTIASIDEKGDVMKEIDRDEDIPHLKNVDPAIVKKASEALKKINVIKDKALAEKYKEAGYNDKK